MRLLLAAIVALSVAPTPLLAANYNPSPDVAQRIINGLHACWNYPYLGEPFALIAEVNSDYSVEKIRLSNTGEDERYETHPAFRDAADKAIEAVVSCGPKLFSLLPSDRYAEWKDMRLVFDPQMQADSKLDFDRQKDNNPPQDIWSHEWHLNPQREHQRKF